MPNRSFILRPEQEAALREIAAKRGGVSLNALVREAVTKFIAAEKRK